MMRESEELSQEAVAFHEAGHAVLAWTFGLTSKTVSVVPAENWRGRVDYGQDGSQPDGSEAETAVVEAYALTCLAGEVAVELWSCRAVDWAEWAALPGSDIDNYNETAWRLGWYVQDGMASDLRPVLSEKVAQVRSLLKERWVAVETLARELLKVDELSGGEAVRLLSKVSGAGPIASVSADLEEERRFNEVLASGDPAAIARALSSLR